MPLYEDLVARALAAQRQARSLTAEAERVSELARVLRDAHAGNTLPLRCAWCGRIQIGDEWLRLEAIGGGQMWLADRLVRQSTHGICPQCFESVSEDVEAQRSRRRTS